MKHLFSFRRTKGLQKHFVFLDVFQDVFLGMDPNSEAAIICVGALVSLASSLTLASALFGLCHMPSLECPCSCSTSNSDDNDSEWCLILALRWFFYKYCCCCCRRHRLQDWLKEDLRKLEVSSKFGPYCCQAALQHVVVPEHVAPLKCSSKKLAKCKECGQTLVCERHEEWKDKTVCECVKELSPE